MATTDAEGMTDEGGRTWGEFLGSLAPELRGLAERLPPGCCCALRTQGGPRGHLRVNAWGWDPIGGLCAELQHGEDSFLPGFSAVGVPAVDILPCGCGQWRPSSRAQVLRQWARIPQDRRRILEARRDEAKADRNTEEFERMSALLADEAFMSSRPPCPFGDFQSDEGEGHAP